LKYGKLSIRFNDEEAADYGGVTREWYQELTKEMFNPNYALFTPSAEKMGVTYQPNTMVLEEKAKLLQFATGTSKVPLDGFSKLQGSGGLQKFQIHKDFGATTRLPSAHTCFNQIDLPGYDSYEQLRERLYIAVSEGSTGFGFE
jgi:E3 ubiquitin-protein ligase HUWE1